MLPPGINTPREAVIYYEELYSSLIESGEVYPFVYPWASAGAALVILYLMIDHRQSATLKLLRWPVFATLAVFQGWCIRSFRARSSAAAFGVGLLSVWGCFWVASVMIFNDCQTDFSRIERSGDDAGEVSDESAAGSVVSRVTAASSGGDKVTAGSTKGPAQRHGKLFWQSYPAGTIIERLDWIADVFCGFRGVGWSWQLSGVPPPPRWVEAELRGEPQVQKVAEPERVSKTGIRRYDDRSVLLKEAIFSLVVGYVALDVIITLMHRDTYFLGYIDAAAPGYLPLVVRNSFVLTKCYRLLLSCSAVYTALWVIFKLGPVFFCGIVGPKWIGVRGEPWMNPLDMYGSFSLVLDKGLAGWWGGFWHQTFRFAFEAPTTSLLSALGVSKRSAIGKVSSLCIAFFLSGCIHACGSYTQLGDTRPIRPMCFFLLQGVGILLQMSVVQLLAEVGIAKQAPRSVRRITNLLVVFVWLYFTAPLLVDDFARGGVWMFEPVPLSPLRGLGYGAPDDHFLCSWNPVFWRTGSHWYNTGLAL